MSDSPRDVVCLLVDVAGFTSLSEELASHGPEESERLDRTVSFYFDFLTGVIQRHGGYIIKVSGDALTVIFVSDHQKFRELVRRAASCAVMLQKESGKQAPIQLPSRTARLAHKIGLGMGKLVVGEVGDPGIRMENVFAGKALDSAAAEEHLARPGEI